MVDISFVLCNHPDPGRLPHFSRFYEQYSISK